MRAYNGEGKGKVVVAEVAEVFADVELHAGAEQNYPKGESRYDGDYTALIVARDGLWWGRDT